MDIEELKKALETDEGKKVLGEIIEKEVSGLKSKRDELLGSLKKEKDEKFELSKRLDALEEAKAKAEEEALNKSGDVEKITSALKEKHQKEIDALKADKEELQGQLNTHVLDGGLTAALTKVGVSAPLMDAARALIKMSYKGEVGNNDGTPFAKFDGKNVNEFVTEWAGSETGKHFVSAKSNSGGGSNGANGGGKAPGAKEMSRADFDQLSHAEQSKFSVEGGRLVD